MNTNLRMIRVLIVGFAANFLFQWHKPPTRKLPQPYSRADDCARLLYGCRDDD